MSARDAVLFALTGHQLALIASLPRELDTAQEQRTAARLEARGLIQYLGERYECTRAGAKVLDVMAELCIEAPAAEQPTPKGAA